jgi:hypothetical protein
VPLGSIDDETHFAAAAVALAALAALPAAASTVTLDYVGSSVFGAPNLSETVRIEGPGRARHCPGRSVPDDRRDRRFRAVVLRHRASVGNGVTYTEVQPARRRTREPAEPAVHQLLRQVDTTTEGAAFQVAIWEIVYENLAGP